MPDDDLPVPRESDVELDPRHTRLEGGEEAGTVFSTTRPRAPRCPSMSRTPPAHGPKSGTEPLPRRRVEEVRLALVGGDPQDVADPE